MRGRQDGKGGMPPGGAAKVAVSIAAGVGWLIFIILFFAFYTLPLIQVTVYPGHLFFGSIKLDPLGLILTAFLLPHLLGTFFYKESNLKILKTYPRDFIR